MRVRNVLVRRLLPLSEVDAAIEFYQSLFGQEARLRFDYPEKSLRVAQVGQVVFIGGDAGSLEPFKKTAMTFLVNGIDEYAEYLPSQGATIIRPVQRVPSGRNMLVRHPDGAMVEYVEHADPNPADDIA